MPSPSRKHPDVGDAVHQVLLDLGGSNPERGVQTILEALAEVAAPLERMQDLFDLGQRRLEQQQELVAIPNPTGYLIGIMRNVAVEGMLKGWNVAQMWAEDEEKHAQTRRHAVQRRKQIADLRRNRCHWRRNPPLWLRESVAPDLSWPLNHRLPARGGRSCRGRDGSNLAGLYTGPTRQQTPRCVDVCGALRGMR